MNRIAAAACGDSCPLAIEIGPGKGALTECLLERARRVVAIEVDSYLIHYLRRKFVEEIEAPEPRLVIVEGDVLKTDLGQWGPSVMAGNLPYYITSPILGKLFAPGVAWQRAAFLVQKEVAERMAAEPGSRDYGFLSAETKLFSTVELLFAVPRTAFHPVPKVDSAVVRLTPRNPAADWGVSDIRGFLEFAALCFRQKRKTLRNNLIARFPKDVVDALPEARLRAEQLPLGAMVDLYRRLEKGTA